MGDISTCSNHSVLRSKCGILRSTEVCLPTRSGSGREIEFSRICAEIIAQLRDLFLASKLGPVRFGQVRRQGEFWMQNITDELWL